MIQNCDVSHICFQWVNHIIKMWEREANAVIDNKIRSTSLERLVKTWKAVYAARVTSRKSDVAHTSTVSWMKQ